MPLKSLMRSGLTAGVSRACLDEVNDEVCADFSNPRADRIRWIKCLWLECFPFLVSSISSLERGDIYVISEWEFVQLWICTFKSLIKAPFFNDSRNKLTSLFDFPVIVMSSECTTTNMLPRMSKQGSTCDLLNPRAMRPYLRDSNQL